MILILNQILIVQLVIEASHNILICIEDTHIYAYMIYAAG